MSSTGNAQGGRRTTFISCRAWLMMFATAWMGVAESAAASPVSECALVDLGTLGGRFSWATAVNERGQVIGNSYTANGSYHGFFWTAQGGMVDLGARVEPAAVNERGQVIGRYYTANGEIHAFMWRTCPSRERPPSPADSAPNDSALEDVR